MLSKELNERLTRVGPGTPMGELLRRYWHPIPGAASSQGCAAPTELGPLLRHCRSAASGVPVSAARGEAQLDPPEHLAYPVEAGPHREAAPQP